MFKATSLALLVALGPTAAFADDSGALTGAVGGAVTGAVVGGPAGAAVGAGAGAVIGGGVTGPNRPAVVVQPVPVAPCQTQTTTTTDNAGDGQTTQTTNCPP